MSWGGFSGGGMGSFPGFGFPGGGMGGYSGGGMGGQSLGPQGPHLGSAEQGPNPTLPCTGAKANLLYSPS